MVDQVDAGVVLPAGQQRLEHTRGGRLADGDAARDTDDERHRPVRIVLLAEELRGGGEQPLVRGDLQVDQPGQRQVDLFDLEQVDAVSPRPRRPVSSSSVSFSGVAIRSERHWVRSNSTYGLGSLGRGICASLASNVDGMNAGMDSGTLIREYLLLGSALRPGRGGLRRLLHRRPGAAPPGRRRADPDPADLARQARRLLAECRGTEGLERAARRAIWPPTCRRWPARAASSPARTSGSSRRSREYFDVDIAKGDPERYRRGAPPSSTRRSAAAARWPSGCRPTAPARRSRRSGWRSASTRSPSALRDTGARRLPAAGRRDHHLRGGHRQAVVGVQLLPRRLPARPWRSTPTSSSRCRTCRAWSRTSPIPATTPSTAARRPGWWRARAGRADHLPGQHPAMPDGRGSGRSGAVRRDRARTGAPGPPRSTPIWGCGSTANARAGRSPRPPRRWPTCARTPR